MPKKVLFFFPHNPYPPRSGAHQRCLEMLSGLRALGCATTLVSTTLFSDTQWETASVEALEREWVERVLIYETTRFDHYFRAALMRTNRLLGRRGPLNSALYNPPALRRWAGRACDRIEPDLAVINYAYWDGLLPRHAAPLTAIETHDLLTLNQRMREALQQRLPTQSPASLIDAAQVAEDVLREDFFDRLGLEADPEEFRIYDKYDYTIAISAKEAALIRQRTKKTETLHIPMTQQVKRGQPTYDGEAIFVTGPNPFNLQGYLYFVKHVLPRLRRQSPSFTLRVTGACCQSVLPAEGVLLSGFVPDLESVYESARFAICPVFGGTGEQVKVVEAMSYGVPVIVSRAAAESSPVRHGVNGMVANNAEEFADYCAQLWSDRALCQRLGQAARETVAADYSRSRLLQGLANLVGQEPATTLSSSNVALPGAAA
ncbi:MAG: glycosyltransferase family 4 protein [Blastocatellia bacterium]